VDQRAELSLAEIRRPQRGRLKATLEIPGMKPEGRDLLLRKLRRRDFRRRIIPLFGPRKAWYTLNAIGPGTPVSLAKPIATPGGSRSPGNPYPFGCGRDVGVFGSPPRALSLVEIRDFRGRVAAKAYAGTGPAEIQSHWRL